jgi:hypothetical protein
MVEKITSYYSQLRWKILTKLKANPNSIIGHMTQESEGIHLVTRANTKIALKARGWNALTVYRIKKIPQKFVTLGVFIFI